MSGTCGPISLTCFGYVDRATRSLRTSQDTFPWDSTPSSPTLPTSGSMRNGRLYARPTSAPPTTGGACSSQLVFKTPTSNIATRGSQHPGKRKAGGHGPNLRDEVEYLLPTPRTSDKKGAGPHGTGGMDLRTTISTLLPTPTATDSKSSSGANPEWGHGETLTDAARSIDMFPTPRATDGTHGGPNQRDSRGNRALPSAVTCEGRSTGAGSRRRCAGGKRSRAAKPHHQLTFGDD